MASTKKKLSEKDITKFLDYDWDESDQDGNFEDEDNIIDAILSEGKMKFK